MAKLVLALCLMGVLLTISSGQNSRGFFPLACMDVTKNVIYFVGSCPFYYLDFYDNIESTVDYMKKANSAWTIDQFLREHLFVDSTKYFRDTYAFKKEYIDSLNGNAFAWIADK